MATGEHIWHQQHWRWPAQCSHVQANLSRSKLYSLRADNDNGYDNHYAIHAWAQCCPKHCAVHIISAWSWCTLAFLLKHALWMVQQKLKCEQLSALDSTVLMQVLHNDCHICTLHICNMHHKYVTYNWYTCNIDNLCLICNLWMVMIMLMLDLLMANAVVDGWCW